MQLTFTPTTTGRRTGQLVATSSRGDVNVALSGAGVGVGQITAEPAAVTFDPLHPGQSASRTITMRNSGSAPMKIDGAHIANSTVGDISVTGCQDVQLGPGQTCELVVTVTPTKVGDWQANVEIAADGDVLATVLAHGTAVGTPRVVPASTSVNFDRTIVGKTAEPQTVRIDNKGDGATRVDDATTTGANASDFVVEGCRGADLAPQTSCTLSIRFAPTARGTRSGAVEVRMADGAPLRIDLQGVAVGTGVPKLDSTAVQFEDTHVKAASKPRTIVVTNVGDSDLDVKGPALSGTNAADFSATGCQNVRLAPGKTCNVTVTMTPTAIGVRSAQVTVGVGEGTSPTATLTGTGTASSDLGLSALTNSDGLHVIVKNGGPDGAEDVVVTVNVTGGTITTVGAPCTKIDDQQATCRLGALGPNAQKDIPFRAFDYNRVGTKTVVFAFRVQSSSVDAAPGNDSYQYVDRLVS
jgi:uncharacterized cupredoxin-like copper-binding protein